MEGTNTYWNHFVLGMIKLAVLACLHLVDEGRETVKAPFYTFYSE